MSPRILIALVALPLLVSCGSSDPTTKSPTVPPTTTASGDIQLSTTPTSQWGDTAKCPLPAGSTVAGSPATESIAGVQEYPKASQDHADGCLDYPMYPPIGGHHNGAWATCGFYSSPVPIVHAVHSMEHGGVWIAFSPDLAPSEVKAIKAAADASTFVLANPYPQLGSPIVMSAWTRQLRLDSTTDPRFAQFISTYVQGPQTPELGPPCQQGLGTPG